MHGRPIIGVSLSKLAISFLAHLPHLPSQLPIHTDPFHSLPDPFYPTISPFTPPVIPISSQVHGRPIIGVSLSKIAISSLKAQLRETSGGAAAEGAKVKLYD